MIVRTAFSVYMFDRDAMTASRVTEHGGVLRRDGELLPLLKWPHPRLGEEMLLLLRVREDGQVTVRRTSFVIEINPGDELRHAVEHALTERGRSAWLSQWAESDPEERERMEDLVLGEWRAVNGR